MNDMGIFSLRGRTALVTGAAGHLGSAIAYALGQAGAHVLVNGRNESRAELLVQDMARLGLSVEKALFNITDEGEVRRFFEARSTQPLHVIVNNAYAGGAGTIATSRAESYRQSYEVGVVAPHTILQCALPSLRRAKQLSGDASVVNIASMYGLVSPNLAIYGSADQSNPPFYGAAKAGLIQWTKYAACEFAPEGIRVNSISPGPFPSPAVQASDPEFVDRLRSRVPLARVGDATEIQGPVLFLASSASSFVTGANLVVDGGWTAW